MSPHTIILVLQTLGLRRHIRDRVACADEFMTFMLIIVIAVEVSDLLQGSEVSPTAIIIGVVSVSIVPAGLPLCSRLERAFAEHQGDEARHKNKSRSRQELNLLCWSAVVGGGVPDMVNGDSLRHNVFEVQEVEVDSIVKGVVVHHICVLGLRAERAVSCEIRSHPQDPC